MARARNIKPGFYKNEDLAECSIWARFIFPGLWMLADREGRLEDRPKRIKGELLPFDSHDAEPLLNELKARGFIERYEVDGRAFIQIVAFSKHQNPHHREPKSTIPAPQSPRPSTDGTHQTPEALPPCNKQKAQGKPKASPGLSPPRRDLEGGVNPADSLIPDSLIPDSKPSVVASDSSPTTPRASPAAAVCARLRRAGVASVNPSHPKLLALLAAGMPGDELADLATEPASRGKGFAWLLAAAEGRRRDAAEVGNLPNARASPARSRDEERREVVEVLTGKGGGRGAAARVIDGEVVGSTRLVG